MDIIEKTPAANHLFQVQEEIGDLSVQQHELYKTLLENTLFVSCLLWTNIKTSIAFLTTKFEQHNLDRYNKLVRCIRHIRFTVKISLTLESNKASISRWCIDESYGVYLDMKRYSAGIILLGKGAMQSK